MRHELIRRSHSKANRLRPTQTTGSVAPRAKEAPMAGRSGLSKRTLVLANGVVLLAALGLCLSAASAQSQAPRQTKPFHATKDCSGHTGLPYCTVRKSNVKALKPGSKIFYLAPDSSTMLDSDIAIYVEPGTDAIGHCLLHLASGKGLCTVSVGTGALAGFRARVRVTTDPSVPGLYHWDGTYSFDKR